MRRSYALVLVPALVGAVLGVIAYFSPNTGVDGTLGALLALLGAVAVALGSLLAMIPGLEGWGLRILSVLIGVGALLTAAAAYFLMQYPFTVAMGVASLGLLFAAGSRSARRTT